MGMPLSRFPLLQRWLVDALDVDNSKGPLVVYEKEVANSRKKLSSAPRHAEQHGSRVRSVSFGGVVLFSQDPNAPYNPIPNPSGTRRLQNGIPFVGKLIVQN